MKMIIMGMMTQICVPCSIKTENVDRNRDWTFIKKNIPGGL
jgi:hypothetical protein